MKFFSVLAGIVVLPIVLIVLGVMFCEANKYYWDRKIDGWCESEKVKIYEVQYLDENDYKNLYDSTGKFGLYSEGVKEDVKKYFIDPDVSVIRKSFPKIQKHASKIIRRSDGFVVAEFISYSRTGADFPTIIGHPSSYSCPTIFQRKDIQKEVIRKVENNDE